jgi:AcrR family transcriptional regulator
MAQRKPPRRTRERILGAALALMNRDGEPHVTTSDIADELNISPGNLYYHFRNKDEIIGELYAALEARIAPLLAAPGGRAPDVEDLWLMLHLLFEGMWEYRFFYRDLDEITSRNRRVAQRFADLTHRGEATVIELCRGLAATGALRASEREIAALARNVVIVATFWMSYQRIGAPPRSGAGGDAQETRLSEAVYQVLSLVAPFLAGDGRALIERLGAAYLRGTGGDRA